MSDPTATGPNGEKIVYRGGKWQPLDAPAAVRAEPTATNDKGEKIVYRDGQWQPWQPNFGAATDQPPAERPAMLGAALDARAAASPEGLAEQLRQRQEEGKDIVKTVGSELVRLPAYAAGAAGDVINTIAKPIGTAIGDIARRATGKEGYQSPEDVPDPAHLGDIPGSEDIRTAASNLTGVELHDPTTTPGKVAQVVTDLVAPAGPGRAARVAEEVAGAAGSAAKGAIKAGERVVASKSAGLPRAKTPSNPVIKEVTAGKPSGPEVRERLQAVLADPDKMARFSPEEQAIMAAIAKGGWTEKIAAQVGKLATTSPLAILLGIHTLGKTAAIGGVARGLERFATKRNIQVLNAIIGGEAEAAPAAVSPVSHYAPRTAPSPAPVSVTERLAAERAARAQPAPAPPPAPMEEPPPSAAPAGNWADARDRNWAEIMAQRFDFDLR